MRPYKCEECGASIFCEGVSHHSHCSKYPRSSFYDDPYLSTEEKYGMTDAEFKDMVLPDEGDHG